ncbi:Aldehyde/histidinol dehydrogenase [Delphinella strobiligena]|nr:Aldehyde/histidinol dehydrogenase [Delphinella strobiligena]
MSKPLFPRLQAAAIDGRTRNILYRQEQLFRLHKALVQESEAIVNAIASDLTRGEAQVEYALALKELRERYAELDAEKGLEDEYAIANGKDAAGLRIGAGIVLIKAYTDHTFFFSVVAPLSAAIAAGNCVVVQIDNSLRSLPELLKSILKEVLDADTFDISQQPISDSAFLDRCLQVVQDYDPEQVLSQHQIVSSTNIRTAAVVDRAADLDKAAKALVNARFAYKGRSPYAPDVVLVNEFIKKDFLQAVVRHSISVESESVVENGSSEKQKTNEHGLKELVQDLQRNGDVRVIAQEAGRAIVDIRRRSPQILRKVKEPCLIVHAVRSLDDAIDFLNGDGKECLAAYHWGGAAQCKYLSQFVSARVSFANHIPAEILVGPSFPTNHSVAPSTRYPTSLFSKPAPAFISPSPSSMAVGKALLSDAGSKKAAALQALKQEAVSDLPRAKRPKQMRAGFGFFEQALVTHVSTILLSIVTVVGGGVYFLRRAR